MSLRNETVNQFYLSWQTWVWPGIVSLTAMLGALSLTLQLVPIPPDIPGITSLVTTFANMAQMSPLMHVFFTLGTGLSIFMTLRTAARSSLLSFLEEKRKTAFARQEDISRITQQAAELYQTLKEKLSLISPDNTGVYWYDKAIELAPFPSGELLRLKPLSPMYFFIKRVLPLVGGLVLAGLGASVVCALLPIPMALSKLMWFSAIYQSLDGTGQALMLGSTIFSLFSVGFFVTQALYNSWCYDYLHKDATRAESVLSVLNTLEDYVIDLKTHLGVIATQMDRQEASASSSPYIVRSGSATSLVAAAAAAEAAPVPAPRGLDAAEKRGTGAAAEEIEVDSPRSEGSSYSSNAYRHK